MTTYLSLPEILKQEHTIIKNKPLILRFNYQGKNIIYKQPLPPTNQLKGKASFFKKINSQLKKNISNIKQKPVERHIAMYEQQPIQNIVENYKEWAKKGIAVPEILFYNDSEILFEDLGDNNIKKLLSQPEFQQVILNSFFYSFHNIRDAAKETEDIKFIHTDPWPRHFIYNERTNQTSTIDSEEYFLPSLNLQEQIAVMDLHMIYGLLQLETDHKHTYLQSYINTLDNNEKDTISSLHKPINPTYRAILDTKRAIQNLLKKENKKPKHAHYSASNFEYINNLLESN